MTLQDGLSVNFKSRPELREKLQDFADQHGCTSHVEILEKMYQKATSASPSSKQPSPKSAPVSSDTHFVAKIHPRAVSMVQNLRDSMFEKHNYTGDDQILVHFCKLNKKEQEQAIFIVEAPQKVRDLILEAGKDQVESGQVSSFGQFIAKYLFSSLKAGKKQKEEKPKKKGWLDWD